MAFKSDIVSTFRNGGASAPEQTSDPKLYLKDAEGGPQLELILRMLYGAGTAAVMISAYFIVGQRHDPDTFVFRNNEGFIAAISLLVIVLTGAAVQTFSDVASQIRKREDEFELEISRLAQHLSNLDEVAEALWDHLTATTDTITNEFESAIRKIPSHKRALISEAVKQGAHHEINQLILRESSKAEWTPNQQIERVERWIKNGSCVKQSPISDAKFAIYIRKRDSEKLIRNQDDLVERMGLPADEQIFQILFDTWAKLDPNSLGSFVETINQCSIELDTRTQRHLDRYNQGIEALQSSCNALDLDTSIFLDDIIIFRALIGSLSTKSRNKLSTLLPKPWVESSEGQNLDPRLRLSEIGRFLGFSAWFSQYKPKSKLSKHLALSQPQSHQDSFERPHEFFQSFFHKSLKGVCDDVKKTGQSDVPSDEMERGEDDLSSYDANSERMNRFLVMTLAYQKSFLTNIVRASAAPSRRSAAARFEDFLDGTSGSMALSLPLNPTFGKRVDFFQNDWLKKTLLNQSPASFVSVHDYFRLAVSRESVSREIYEDAKRRRLIAFGDNQVASILDEQNEWCELIVEEFGKPELRESFNLAFWESLNSDNGSTNGAPTWVSDEMSDMVDIRRQLERQWMGLGFRWLVESDDRIENLKEELFWTNESDERCIEAFSELLEIAKEKNVRRATEIAKFKPNKKGWTELVALLISEEKPERQ